MRLKINQLILGEYKVLEFLGSGAFGEVYRCLNTNLGIERAVKTLLVDSPGVGSTNLKKYRDRFQLEARLGVRIGQTGAQHVVRAYDFNQGKDGLFMVMEYMPYGSLAKLLAEREPSVDLVIRIASQVAQGLKEIHDLSLVHRDLKPSNILFGTQGLAKISDLGLAQIAGGPSMRSELGSQAMQHPGTPAYMSPEQESTTRYLSPASDTYAFGLVVFEMLTGKHYKNQKHGTQAIT